MRRCSLQRGSSSRRGMPSPGARPRPRGEHAHQGSDETYAIALAARLSFARHLIARAREWRRSKAQCRAQRMDTQRFIHVSH
eukprot:8041359-Pyramimonas_sp.AAC.1